MSTTTKIPRPDSGPCVGATRFMELTDCTVRQLDHWSRRGYIRPERTATGSGNRRRYPLSEVPTARALRALNSISATRMGEVFALVAAAARRGDEEIRIGDVTIHWHDTKDDT